jgi:hypothetical protein
VRPVYGYLGLDDIVKGQNRKSLIQPGLFASVGGGNKDHNTYLYGEDAPGFGITNTQYGLAITSPRVIDVFWPTLKISHFELMGDARTASFVKEVKGWQVEALFAFQIF